MTMVGLVLIVACLLLNGVFSMREAKRLAAQVVPDAGAGAGAGAGDAGGA
jgi:hypothetical protein